MHFSEDAQDASRPESAAGAGTRPPRTQEGVQDILDLIDKLAEVNQQLREPHHEPQHGPAQAEELAGQAPQQPLAVSGAEG
jgi:hypothetical protein